jgi:hypothetical protein
MMQVMQTAGGEMRIFIWVFVLLVLSSAAAADDRAELQDLYATVSAMNQEQQALFQQFQMLQEVRRANDRAFFTSQLRSPELTTGLQNYDDVGRTQREVIRRGEELTRQSDQLYAQYDEIETRKVQLLQRILELSTPR